MAFSINSPSKITATKAANNNNMATRLPSLFAAITSNSMTMLALSLLLWLAVFATVGHARPYNEQLIPADIALNRIDLSPFEENQFWPDFLGGPGIFG